MITVRVESRRWRGIEERLTPRSIDAVVRATALEIEADTKKSIQSGPKTGRVYKRRKRRHQASAPGQAPATDRGQLASSYRTRKVGPGAYRVGSSLKKAPALEFGTRRMRPRPHLRPAFSRGKERLRKRMRTLLEAK